MKLCKLVNSFKDDKTNWDEMRKEWEKAWCSVETFGILNILGKAKQIRHKLKHLCAIKQLSGICTRSSRSSYWRARWMSVNHNVCHQLPDVNPTGHLMIGCSGMAPESAFLPHIESLAFTSFLVKENYISPHKSSRDIYWIYDMAD